MSFVKLDQSELFRTATVDFAVDVNESDTKKVIVAALVESGVEFEQYLKANPAEREKFAPAEPKVSTAITTQAIANLPADEPVEIITKEEHPKLTNTEKYLIKMVRENPLFEIKGHTFTTKHPYVLMDSEDAQYVLSKETGFRQAFPQELTDYYG